MAANRHGLFWNSVSNDRLYDADSFSEWLSKFFTTGVFANELQVTANSGLGLSVSKGYVNVKGKVRFFDETSYLTLSPANPSYPRIDTVVIERNNTNREITMKVVTGSLSGSLPRATSPVRNSAIYQLILAEILVPAGATSISQSNITDKRLDTSVCGIVTGTVEELNAEQLHAQLNSKFNDWFNGIKGKLSSDVAGSLQNQMATANQTIGQHDSKIRNLESQYSVDHSTVQSLLSASSQHSSKIAELERKSRKTIKSITLYSSSWSANKTYTVSDSAIKKNSIVTVSAKNYSGTNPDSSYREYLEKLKAASIVGYRQESGIIYLLATGEKPTVDLNIQLTIEGE